MFTTRKYPFQKAILFLLLVMNFYTVYAESKLTVEAKTDTNQIRIGEQFHLEFTAIAPKEGRILFPSLPDTFNHFEVVNRGKIDTILPSSGNTISFKQRYTITSFDSGYFVIPPFNFLYEQKEKSDSAITEAMLVGVLTIPVDTTKEIRDIKSTMDVPFPWAFYIPIVIGILILIAVAYILYRKWKNKPVSIPLAPPAPVVPPHEIALQQLKKTEEEKLWQQGMFKEYHSAVSDILRTYIEARFSIPAMEYTTDETLQAFRGNLLNDELKNKLRYLLQLADMVKFAKAHPLPHENEQIMRDAILFIEQTRPVVATDFKSEEVKS